MTTNGNVHQFSTELLEQYLGTSDRGSYIIKYLSEIGARTFVVESNYVDKDYMIDYQKFYSRCFEEISKFTTRLHFFSTDFSESDFYEALNKNDVDDLKSSYLGFVVVRPIKSSDGQPLIGRTVLKTYPPTDGDDRRFFVTSKYTASLYGIPLEVESLPYQEQDEGVSACATIALWSALNPLYYLFGTIRHSPAEITEVATSFPSPHRAFPSSGLILEQMVNYIRSIGLDVEAVSAENNDMITTAVKAYINAGLPIIAALKLRVQRKEDYHAVVISGYRCDRKGRVKELYVHDDQIGPYSRVTPVCGSFEEWNNEWLMVGYESVRLDKLLIPVYPKIRLTFPRIYAIYERCKTEIEKEDLQIDLELFLTWVERYKEYLLTQDINEKIKVLTKPMPKYMWILRFHYEGQPLEDVVFDGTSIYPRHLLTIKYNYQ